MIEGLLLPHWAVPVEEPIYKVSGAPLDEPHNLRQAHEQSLCISKRGEKQVRVCRHHHHSVQIDGRRVLPQATLQDQLPSLGGKFPPFECPECYENRTIVFEYVWQSTPVRVFPIKVHLS
jgi:hypothetical protein